MATVGWVLLVVWMVMVGVSLVWFVWAFASGPRRARQLMDALELGDHTDWWAFLTTAEVVGGPPRPAFAFRVLSGGRSLRPAGVCAFDDQMFIAVGLLPLPWDFDHRGSSFVRLKEHARFRAERRMGMDSLLDRSDRTKFWLWGITNEELSSRMSAAGWQVDNEAAAPT